jgi:hypothetical protein
MQRRNFVLGLSALSLPSLLKAQYGAKNAKAKNVINIFLPGGIAAQEYLDPKSLAPSEYRGPFGSIKTNVSGIEIGEKFPKLATVADKFSIIRSMTHGEAAHERGVHSMMTGYKPSPALVYPSMGSVVSAELGSRNKLPAYISVPNTLENGGSGYLSTKYNPFSLGSDPSSPSFKVRDLNSDVDNGRFERRRMILEAVDSKFKNEVKADNVEAIDSFYDQAYDLIASNSAKEAFDLSKEDTKMKEFYGNTQAGQRLLISRRLIEAGVRFLTVSYGGWDMHDNIKNGFERQAPEFDQALSALLADLSSRGLLDETIVVVTSEFGRTPKINTTAGRDHWPRVFSTLIAGGGFQNGNIHGSSDSLGAEVDENPVCPADLSATIFHLMGLDPEKQFMTADLRPIKISQGSIIKDLI